MLWSFLESVAMCFQACRRDSQQRRTAVLSASYPHCCLHSVHWKDAALMHRLCSAPFDLLCRWLLRKWYLWSCRLMGRGSSAVLQSCPTEGSQWSQLGVLEMDFFSPKNCLCAVSLFFGRSHLLCALNFKSYFHMIKFLQSHRTSVQIMVVPALLPLCHALAQGCKVWRSCARCWVEMSTAWYLMLLSELLRKLLDGHYCEQWRQHLEISQKTSDSTLLSFSQAFCILDGCTACNMWSKYRLYSKCISSAVFLLLVHVLVHVIH